MPQSIATIILQLLACCFCLNFQSAIARYKETGRCEEKSCVYDYTMSGNFHDKRGKEEGNISVTFTLQCKSSGLFQGADSKKFCIVVKKATADLFEVKADSKSKNIKRSNKGASDITRLMRKNHFCFIRDKSGKVVNVMHPKGESGHIVNIKKTIASAFQANFRKTRTRVETDATSKHKSHYVYSRDGEKTIEHRYVHSKDVDKYAGSNKKKGIDIESEEDIEVDSNNVIRGSHGQSRTSLTKKVDSEEDDDSNVQEDIPPIESECKYTLKLKECLNSAETFEYLNENSDDVVTDSLMARFSEREHDQFEMDDLYLNLPDLHETVRAARSTDEEQRIEITNALVGKWSRLLHLESKHGTLDGRKPKVFLLKQLLDKSLLNHEKEVDYLRLVLYSLLSSEGSVIAQKALLNALHAAQLNENKQEYDNIVLALALLDSPHPSTVSSFKEHVSSNQNNEQLLLTYATLGRHAHAEHDVVTTILSHSTDRKANESSDILYYMHALGNTGSTLIIPYILPFITSENKVVQQVAIDALRTISTHDSVQKLFIDVIDSDPSLDTLLAIADSLNFPYKSFVYHPELPDSKDNDVEDELIQKLVNATIDADDADLHKHTKQYLKYVDTDTALHFLESLSNAQRTIVKRAQTSVWNSRQSFYNLVASYNSRAADVSTYRYHRAYLWYRNFGPSKIHMKLAAGGFAGAGASGVKVFAKGAIDLYVFGRTYQIVRAEYEDKLNVNFQAYAKSFVKEIGITFLNKRNWVNLPHTESWSKNLYSKRVFRLEYRIWVWIGFLSFYIEGRVSVDASLAITFQTQKVTAQSDFGPTFSVTGGASYTLLFIFRVGIEIKASIGYYVTPKASVTFCDNIPRGDLSGCFGIFHGSKGIKVDIYAFYSRKHCYWKRWWFRCRWGGKRRLSLFSSTYTLGRSLTQKLLWGQCTACDCRGPVHNYCAKVTGAKPVATGCYCRFTTYA